MEKEMTTSNCTVPDCTGNTHGRSYCGKHRDQIAKGYLPNQAPSRLVDSHDTRDRYSLSSRRSTPCSNWGDCSE